MSELHYYSPKWLPSATSWTGDAVVYGGTAAGLVAAIRLKMEGKSVLVAQPGLFLGGMTTGGLGFTDFGNRSCVGGLARQFYQKVGRHYGTFEGWKFEPHVAQDIFESWLSEWQVPVIKGAFLESVDLEGTTIKALRLRGGSVLRGRVFLDTTYEGDLLAQAGVTFTVGREPNSRYGETCNGSQIHPKHQFDRFVDPYRVPGDPTSGLLQGIEAGGHTPGEGDQRIQAYNFRVCMTDDPAIRVPFPQPAGYDPGDYELAARWLNNTDTKIFAKFDRITAHKTDTNNHGAVSTDFIGGNYPWPEATFEQREVLFQSHVRWQQGLHWFMSHDPRVPEAVRSEYSRWGLCRDEFTDTGHWPHQLYVREARRMVSEVVLSERECRSLTRVDDPVGMGAYTMDSHNVRRLVVDGAVKNEGDVQSPIPRPYPISYRSIVPSRGQTTNLLVPVCVSASHIAYGSLRMEPVFMVLAESAGLAASLALEAGCSVQDVSYGALRERLLAVGQVLDTDATNLESGNP